MKIILNGLEKFGLTGEYELDPGPTGREMNRFRKEAELSPSELTDAIANGSLDIIRMYAFVALERSDRAALAGTVFDVPLELLGGIQVEIDDEEAPADPLLPPTSGLASNGSEPESEPRSLTTSSGRSGR